MKIIVRQSYKKVYAAMNQRKKKMNFKELPLSLLMVSSLLIFSISCEDDEVYEEPNLAENNQELYIHDKYVWPSGNINVCWENDSSSNQTERNWVINAVSRTWEDAAAIDFIGWGHCSSSTKGIRILIVDDKDGPQTAGLGTLLDGKKDGMRLNFTFNNWSTGCKSTRQSCIESIAVHEFGHALGFAHEHNRPDTPDTCLPCKKNEDCEDDEYCEDGTCNQGPDGTKTYGAWDLSSTMNYCNPTWNNGGVLSDTDIGGSRVWYSGNVHVHKMNSNGTVGDYTRLEEWPDGYTSAEFYVVDGYMYMFSMEAGGGHAKIHTVDRYGKKGSLIKTYKWSTGWDSVKFYTTGGKTYMFLLKSKDGTVHVHRMNSDGTVGTNIKNYAWSKGWDTVEFFVMNNTHYLYLMKSSDGTVHMHKMNSNGTVGTNIKNYNWSKGWTNAAFFNGGNDKYMIILKSGTGDVHIHKMNSDATVGPRTFTSKWREGWTTVETYSFASMPYLYLLMK